MKDEDIDRDREHEVIHEVGEQNESEGVQVVVQCDMREVQLAAARATELPQHIEQNSRQNERAHTKAERPEHCEGEERKRLQVREHI